MISKNRSGFRLGRRADHVKGTFHPKRAFAAMLIAAVALTGLVSSIPSARASATGMLSVETMERDLGFMQATFSAWYAPAAWKKQHSGWELNSAISSALQTVRQGPLPVRDYQKIVRQFINSTKDYHVGVAFNSTELATLGFDIRTAEGRTFIVYIDRDQLPESAFPFAIGDELVSFGGAPIADALSALRGQIGANNVPETDAALTNYFFTRRSGRMAVDVPRGPVMIEILKKGETAPTRRQVIWNYRPEQIRFTPRSPSQPVLSATVAGLAPLAHLQGLSAHGHLAKMATELDRMAASDAPATPAPEVQPNGFEIGGRTTFLPELGAKIWESAKDNPFHAYIFRHRNNKILGYLRLPSYSAGSTEAKAFGEIIERMQKTTDALVIDQVNNPGGSVFYLYSLVAMLTDQPIATPQHRIALTPNMVQEVIDSRPALAGVKSDADAKKVLGDDIGGYPVTYQVARFFLEHGDFLVDEWKAGKTLTEPVFLGIDAINPHPDAKRRYTKPILLLINELDFSGGDFFPAILQDAKRAKLLGTRTAGAGGYVGPVEYFNQTGIARFSVTGSLAERVNKNPIENLGVTPDIPYSLSAKDHQNSFADYVEAIRTALDQL